MLAYLANQLADRALRLVRAAATDEERGIFLAKRVKPAVGANGGARNVARGLPAADGGCEAANFFRRIGHLVDMGEVDPGEELQEIERKVGRRSGQDHRHDRKV